MTYNKFAALALASITALGASAQSTASGFFNDGYMFRHDMNPAIGNRQSYIALPAISNMNVSLHGNIGLGDIMYQRDGETVSFLSPKVSTEEAVAPFKEDIRLENDMRLDLLSLGFAGRGGRGYTTFEAGLRSRVSLALPGQLFRFAKEGFVDQTYDLSSLGANADLFGEIAVGHSHRIGPNLRIGAKVKWLIGAAHLDATADGTRLVHNGDVWTATTNADINASLNGLKLISDTEMRGPEGQQTPHSYITSVELDKDIKGYSGMGLAFDLGATYKIADCLTLGLAVVDFGSIKWNNSLRASTDGPHSVSIAEDAFDDDDLESIADDLTDLYELRDLSDSNPRTTHLGATINASAEFAMPFYKRMSIGLLSTTRLQDTGNWTEVRASLNLAPLKWLAFSATAATGTFGTSYGGMVSFHPKGFSIYAGADCLGLPFSDGGLPLGHNVQANVGLLFPF